MELNKNLVKKHKMYYIGIRKGQVCHARMRMSCSSLNYHLMSNHLKDSAIWACGAPCENVHHFLFDCPNYAIQRNLMLNILNLPPTAVRDVRTYLNGSERLNEEQNIQIFQAVINYIVLTNRF
jgi:hypothetical protein